MDGPTWNAIIVIAIAVGAVVARAFFMRGTLPVRRTTPSKKSPAVEVVEGARKASLVLTCQIEGIGSKAWIDVVAVKDGIAGMYFTYRAAMAADALFEASVIDKGGSANGWYIQRSREGFMFALVCAQKANGFVNDHGAFYAFRQGTDRTMVDWPNVEGATVPRHCYVTQELFDTLMLKLLRSKSPEGGAGFHYSSNEWELIDKMLGRAA